MFLAHTPTRNIWTALQESKLILNYSIVSLYDVSFCSFLCASGIYIYVRVKLTGVASPSEGGVGSSSAGGVGQGGADARLSVGPIRGKSVLALLLKKQNNNNLTYKYFI